MAELTRDVLEDVAWDSDIDAEKGIYWNYSGRYGLRSDFNIVGSFSDAAKFLVQLAQRDAECAEAAWDMAQSMPTDNMAFDTIFSFPGLTVPDKPEFSGSAEGRGLGRGLAVLGGGELDRPAGAAVGPRRRRCRRPGADDRRRRRRGARRLGGRLDRVVGRLVGLGREGGLR